MQTCKCSKITATQSRERERGRDRERGGRRKERTNENTVARTERKAGNERQKVMSDEEKEWGRLGMGKTRGGGGGSEGSGGSSTGLTVTLL